MQNNLFRKSKILTVIILLFVMFLMPLSAGNMFYYYDIEGNSIQKDVMFDPCSVINNGSLSGYVTDHLMNQIEGALVRVYFHGTYEEDYSDETGYYHVTNIPICWCMKNATCSKEGYKTEWVLLSINENTTYDFVLHPSEPYPVFNGTIGWNGWWISPINISFVFDPEEVAEIWYYYNGWHLYTEPFVVDEEGEIPLHWYWINYEGEQSSIASCYLYIDQTPPIIDVSWTYENGEILIIATCSDEISGVAFVEFYMNEILQEIDDSSPYIWVLKWPYPPPLNFFKIVAYDNAGNSEEATFAYTSPKKMHIIGFIRDPVFSDGYLRLHADFVITRGYYGIIKNKDLTFELFDYSGYIGKRFIRAELTGWWFLIPKNIFSPFTCKI